MKESFEKKRLLSVPKQIHFIWAGGDLLMKGKDEVETVVGWCKANPTCQVNLWVDYRSYPGHPEEMVASYKEIFQDTGVEIITRNDKQYENCTALTIRDISEIEDYRGLLNRVARSEINQIYPNFGCSSDIIRLLILRKGGCYFDQDVRCNPRLSLEDSDIFDARECPLIILEHRPQRHTPDRPMNFESAGSVIVHEDKKVVETTDQVSLTLPKTRSSSDDAADESQSPHSQELTPKSESSSDNTYKRFMKLTFTELGNDAIICTPNNPVILMQLDRIYENYHLKSFQQDLIIEECYGERDRKNRSIKRTGPTVTQDIFTQKLRSESEELKEDALKLYYNKYESPVIDVEAQYYPKEHRDEIVGMVEFQPMRTKTRELTAPETNYQNWLKVNIKIISDQKTCHKAIIERIRFEIEHFGILRLDDHFDLMISSMKIPNNPHIIMNNKYLLLEAISLLDLQNVKLVQCTFKHPESLEFCQSKNLKSIIDLDKNDFTNALQYLLDFVDINMKLMYFKTIQMRYQIDIEDFVNSIVDQVGNSIVEQLYHSISNLEAIMNNIDRLPLANQHALCTFVIKHREFLEYEQAFYAGTKTNLMGTIDRCILKAESYLSKISAVQTHPPNKNNTDNVDQSEINVSSDKKGKGIA